MKDLDSIINQLTKIRVEHGNITSAEIEIKGKGRWGLESVKVEGPEAASPWSDEEEVLTFYAHP